MQPVVAPGERAGDAEGGLVVVGARGRSRRVPGRHVQQPGLGPRQHGRILQNMAGDGLIAHRIQAFLAVDVDLPPDRRGAFSPRIGRRLRDETAVGERLHGLLDEPIEGAMRRRFGRRRFCDPGAKAREVLGIEPQAGMGRGDAPQALGRRRQRGFGHARGHRERTHPAPLCRRRLCRLVPHRIAPAVGARRQCAIGSGIGARDRRHAHHARRAEGWVRGDLEHIGRALVQRRQPGKPRRVLVDDVAVGLVTDGERAGRGFVQIACRRRDIAEISARDWGLGGICCHGGILGDILWR